MAQLAQQSGSPRSIYWRQRLLELEPTNLSNRFELIQTAMLFDQRRLASDTLAGTPTLFRATNALYHQAAAQIAFAQRDVAAAQEYLSTAAKLDGSNVVHSINLAIVRLHSADSGAVRAARHELEGRQSDPAYGGAILRALVGEAIGRNEWNRARSLSLRLMVRQDAVFDDRLVHLTILDTVARAAARTAPNSTNGLSDAKDSAQPLAAMQTHTARGVVSGSEQGPHERSSEFSAVLAMFQAEAAESGERAARFLIWLARHGRAQTGLDWVEHLPDELRSQSLVKRGETECYIAAGKWSELSARLEAGYWGLDDHLRHAFLALAHHQQHNENMARAEWGRAVRSAPPSGFTALVQLAGAWHWEEEAEALLWEAARDGPGSQSAWALDLLARAYHMAGDTTALWRVFATAVSRDPDNLVAKNNLAAACLLLRTNLSSAHRTAKEVYTAEPANPGFACTYAYSIHLQGRSEEGLQLLSRLPDKAKCNPSTAAYYSAMLRSCGQGEEGDKYAALAKHGALLPEERALVEFGLE